ncbi:MAG TPA: hypothetical protein VJI97_02840 [Candidatus Nanoarchaeia archaeon]|nr:hypothetical protein [Candidatus Nanoarchaeia archaeon]
MPQTIGIKQAWDWIVMNIHLILVAIFLTLFFMFWIIWMLISRPVIILKKKWKSGELTKEQYRDFKKYFWWHHGRA